MSDFYIHLYFLSRMTEQEEDEELLTDLNQAKKTVISFDESPTFIKVTLNRVVSLYTVYFKGSSWLNTGRNFLSYT